MKANRIVAVIGVCAAAAGAFLTLWADTLATQWQALGNDAWGGTTDPALVQAYHIIGVAFLAFGLVFLVIATWDWLAAQRREGHPHTSNT